jgi:hypothetical protein
MRFHRVLLVALLVSACAAPPVGDPSGPSAVPGVAGASSASSASVAPSTPRPSVDGHPLSELLPTSINGVTTKVTDLNPVSRSSPRVFLKIIARVGDKPQDGEVALAFIEGATVYAVRVKGGSGEDVLMAYLAERGSVADETPATESVGGKQATRLGKGAGQFLYVSGDVFYSVSCQDDQLAADVLGQLP